jgi:predicted O-methyltransferase YrrM
LASLVAYAHPRSIFEFGTFEGRTTLQIAINSPDESTISTIDLSADDEITRYPRAYADEGRARKLPVGGCFLGHPESRKITQLSGDSATHNFDDFRERVEFVFVDGDHSFEYVKADSENALRMLAPGGLILWHDYSGSWPGVSQYLRQLAGTRTLFHIAETSLVVYGPTLQPRSGQK